MAKSDSAGHKMKLKLMGAIIHGHGAMVFTQLENLATGSNYVIEVHRFKKAIIIYRLTHFSINDCTLIYPCTGATSGLAKVSG